MRKTELIAFAIILLSFLLGLAFYPRMPEQVASHWNARGQVDGYMSRFWGVFLLPAVSVGLFLLFILIPRIDPLKANIERFRQQYDRFVLLILVYFLYIYLLTLLWNIGIRPAIMPALAPAMAALLYYSGVVMEHAKRNWFIGIRTPWTLSSDAVWEKTHRLGGKLFKVIGVISLLGIVIGEYGLALMLVLLLAATGYVTVYSYLEYQKEARGKV